MNTAQALQAWKVSVQWAAGVCLESKHCPLRHTGHSARGSESWNTDTPVDPLSIVPGVTQKSESSRDIKSRMWKLKCPKALRIQGSKSGVSSAVSSLHAVSAAHSPLSSYQMLVKHAKKSPLRSHLDQLKVGISRCGAKPPH